VNLIVHSRLSAQGLCDCMRAVWGSRRWAV
jgi:hypothetical protein